MHRVCMEQHEIKEKEIIGFTCIFWETSEPMLLVIYSKNASSVAIFLEVVHYSVDEYLRKILQHLHELHRKGPYFFCCDDKDAMTVTTQKKMKN